MTARRTVTLTHSRTYPVAVDDAFDAVLPLPLPQLFRRRYAAIPAIREVRDQAGAWATPGQTRTIVLADGGTMRETLVEVDRPRRFGYRIEELTGPLKPLVETIDGSWTFAPAGTGCRITWAWDLHPRGTLGTAAMPLLGRMWQGYAARAFATLEDLVVT